MDDVKKKELIEKAYNLAVDYERKYGGCSQCVLAAIQESIGYVTDDVFKSAYSLVGGMGLAGDGTCGALAGGAVAISCKYGREKKNFATKVPKVHRLSRKLHDKFVAEYGGTICREVQKRLFGKSFNMWIVEDYKEFERLGGHQDKCPIVTGNVAKWTAEIMMEEENPPTGQ